MAKYTGPVVYMDGWHYSVDKNDQPDKKLYFEDDGTFRFAKDGDESWYDRAHARYATMELT
jgi:hypothetical protein